VKTLERDRSGERGVTLVELLAALIVISIGVLALVRLFPTAERNQQEDRMLTSGNLYAQEKVEQLVARNWIDPELTIGRHPAGSVVEDLGTTGKWHRFYVVSQMATPLDNLKKITVTVTWDFMGSRSVTATTYVRH
jgi:prepilin-type N-terminal cleavage/methylation domain-containing protein